MKKFTFLLVAIVAIGYSSCTKDNSISPAKKTLNKVATVKKDTLYRNATLLKDTLYKK